MYIEWHRNPYNKACIAWCDVDGDIIAIASEDEYVAESSIKAKIYKCKGKGYARFIHLAPSQSTYDKVPWSKLSQQSYKMAYYVSPKALAAKAKAAGIDLEGNPINIKKEPVMEEQESVDTKESGYISETKAGYIHIYKVKKYVFDGNIDYELTKDGKLIVTVKEKVNIYPLAD